MLFFLGFPDKRADAFSSKPIQINSSCGSIRRRTTSETGCIKALDKKLAKLWVVVEARNGCVERGLLVQEL